MKSMMIIYCFLLLSCGGNTAPVGQDYQIVFVAEQADPVLENIQYKISGAFATAMAGGGITGLEELDQQLAELEKANGQNIITYWRAYLHFYQAIFYLGKGDEKNAEQATEKAVDWMIDMKQKNSEDYALLSMLRGFSIQFKSGIKAPFIGSKSEKDAELAIALDSINLRAWFVGASSDYYTPETYGGGKNVEKYLQNALACDDQKIENKYLPSWGREEAYEMLIRFYMRKENWELAKSTFSEANEKFPNNYMISQLATKLVGK